MRCILGIKRNESMKFDMSAADDDIINILVFLTLWSATASTLPETNIDPITRTIITGWDAGRYSPLERNRSIYCESDATSNATGTYMAVIIFISLDTVYLMASYSPLPYIPDSFGRSIVENGPIMNVVADDMSSAKLYMPRRERFIRYETMNLSTYVAPYPMSEAMNIGTEYFITGIEWNVSPLPPLLAINNNIIRNATDEIELPVAHPITMRFASLNAYRNIKGSE